MYLIDTNVISEVRKGPRSNPGVRSFFATVVEQDVPIFISVITVGELRRGVELIRHRGDAEQADQLERWLQQVVDEYQNHVLPFDHDAAQVWGHLRVPHPENVLDKQIAATGLLHDLTIVTRNERDFTPIGVRTLNPFAGP